MSPPVLHYPLRALLAQHNDIRQEQAIYYLNRTMIGADSLYNPIEKECLALMYKRYDITS